MQKLTAASILILVVVGVLSLAYVGGQALMRPVQSTSVQSQTQAAPQSAQVAQQPLNQQQSQNGTSLLTSPPAHSTSGEHDDDGGSNGYDD